jgi:hypothetical protein
MSYLYDDDGEPTSKKAGAAIAGFILFSAIALAAKFVDFGLLTGSKQEWTAERVRSELEATPELRELFVAIKTHYPREYDGFVHKVAETARSGDGAAVSRQSFAFTRKLMTDHFEDMARAPSAEIHEIGRRYAQLVNVLDRTDVQLCSQFLTTGFTPGAKPAPEALSILSRIGALQITAAKHGETQPRDPRGALSDSDGQLFYRELVSRSPGAGAFLGDERALNAATPDVQCDLGVAIYESAAALPTESAANVTIDLLRASLQAAAPAP